MADPLTWTILGIVGVATAVTGGVIGGVEQHEQAKEQAKISERNAKLQQAQLEYNQRMEQREAAAIEAETAENARRAREEAEQLKAAQRALLGKSGAAMTSGSPLAILGATAADEEIKIQDIHYTGSRSAAAHLNKATDYAYGVSIAKQNVLAAKAAKPSGLGLGASIGGTVGNGLASVAQIGMAGAKAGAFDSPKK